jgi:hypothetical protein
MAFTYTCADGTKNSEVLANFPSPRYDNPMVRLFFFDTSAFLRLIHHALARVVSCFKQTIDGSGNLWSASTEFVASHCPGF